MTKYLQTNSLNKNIVRGDCLEHRIKESLRQSHNQPSLEMGQLLAYPSGLQSHTNLEEHLVITRDTLNTDRMCALIPT